MNLSKALVSAAAALCIVLAASTANALTVTVAQGATGSSGSSLNNIVLTSGNPIVNLVPPNAAYDNTATTPASNWVWDSTLDNGTNWPTDPIEFRFSFSLAASQLSTASLSGLWGVDNIGTVYLNGNQISSLSTVSTSTFNPLTAFSVATGSAFFNAGNNLLTFVVQNATSAQYPNSGPAAFRAALTVTASPVPLPAAAWLFISALGGLVLVGRRRRMHGAAA